MVGVRRGRGISGSIGILSQRKRDIATANGCRLADSNGVAAKARDSSASSIRTSEGGRHGDGVLRVTTGARLVRRRISPPTRPIVPPLLLLEAQPPHAAAALPTAAAVPPFASPSLASGDLLRAVALMKAMASPMAACRSCSFKMSETPLERPPAAPGRS